jgi:hypothetical protein
MGRSMTSGDCRLNIKLKFTRAKALTLDHVPRLE